MIKEKRFQKFERSLNVFFLLDLFNEHFSTARNFVAISKSARNLNNHLKLAIQRRKIIEIDGIAAAWLLCLGVQRKDTIFITTALTV